MKLSVIVPVHNQYDLTLEFLENLINNSTTKPEVLLIDNGSLAPFRNRLNEDASARANFIKHHDGQEISLTVIWNPQNIGVFDTFEQGLVNAKGQVLCYLHNDLFIEEHGWDRRLLDAFGQDEKLGLVGFVGSNEWDWDGGRGLGTMSNFQGIGRGSPAEAHGARITDLRAAVIVDGCVMALRKTVLADMALPEDFPPHHFYDRLISWYVYKMGYRCAVLGIACDHVSGQTANQEKGWHSTAQEWCENHGLTMQNGNWDNTIYLEAERRFLEEFHSNGPFRKIVVNADYSRNLLS